ncbi:MAG: S8 family serine peptidase, partial [Candidatus Eisenbacteria bacterium]|nr:S8 family serine peptidase [Candidatus Eisenbacteria bacterium]
VIAVIDGEILQTHPDIQPNLWWNPEEAADGEDNDVGRERGQIDDIHGWNFTLNPTNPGGFADTSTDTLNHGTSVAGAVIAARQGSGLDTGVVGVAYNCRLMCLVASLRVEVGMAIQYAINQGADVISMSIGGGIVSGFDPVGNAMRRAVMNGIPIFISTGNGADGPQRNDCAFTDVTFIRDGMIAVGNVCFNGERVPSSSYLPESDGRKYLSVVAPGGGVPAASFAPDSVCAADQSKSRFTHNSLFGTDGEWTPNFGGTSVSAPFVAGIGALLKSDDPDLSASSVREIIELSAVDVLFDPTTQDTLVGWDYFTGYGVANAHRALLYPMILKPDASETVWCGDSIDIEWRVPKTNTSKDTCDVYVSYDGGDSFTSIATDLVFSSYPGTYSWTVPEPTEDHIDEVYFRVIARHDEEGAGDSRYSVADTSDFALTIRKSLAGTMSSDSTWSERAVVGGDFTVPSGKTLTVDPGTEILFKDEDSTSGGSDSLKSELIVKGKLSIPGTVSSPVSLKSRESVPAEGDWYGISATTSTGVIDLAHTTIRDAVYGVVSATDTTIIDTCTFLANENQDLKLGGSPDVCKITGCTITVSGGTGIDAQDGADSIELLSNTILCDSLTTNGIWLENPDATVTGNTVKDCTAGNAVYIYAGSPSLTKNTIKDSKYGIFVDGGSPDIGTSATDSDNTITGNTRGIYSKCRGPGSCPVCNSFAPKVRNNYIASNATGIYVDKRGFIDCGTSALDPGNNTFAGNTAYCIRNVGCSSDTVQAVGNWFGAFPPTVCWNGQVDATLPLATAPSSIRTLDIERVHPFKILGVIPNPVVGSAQIQFYVPDSELEVEIQILSVSGRLIRSFGTKSFSPGHHEFTWDGNSSNGRAVASGVYFVRGISGSETVSHRFLVLR